MRYPDFVENLKQWCGSPNRWVRRAAAVSLINPAHDGQFKAEIFEIANRLLLDPDDMIQKGYGWMLKAASEALGVRLAERGLTPEWARSQAEALGRLALPWPWYECLETLRLIDGRLDKLAA